MARAEGIRAILYLAKVQYEDIRLTQEEFQKLKSEGLFEFDQIPALVYEGKTLT